MLGFGAARSLLRRLVARASDPPVRVALRENNREVALILIHGFSGDTSATWGRMPEFLMQARRLDNWDLFGIGYPSTLRVDVPNVWSADPDIHLLAKSLRTTLSLPPLGRYRCLAVAAHSMGGLIVQRAILDDENLQSRLSHLLLFGTPSAGLAKARLFRGLKRQLRDMAPDSGFIIKLRKDWTQRFGLSTPFRLRVVGGDRDEFVGADSSLEPFPDPVRDVISGNHLEIVKPQSPDHEAVVLMIDALTGGLAVRAVVDSARLAVEMGEFRSVVNTLLPHADALDDVAVVTLALALEGIGDLSGALKVLEDRYKSGTSSIDAIGVLAGRVKRRWLAERRADDLVGALDLYRSGFQKASVEENHAQCFYHAINVAFLFVVSSPPLSPAPDDAITWADRAISHCKQVEEDRWQLATLGEAYLIRGESRYAEHLYKKAIEMTESPREIDSMYSQAVRLSTHLFGRRGAGGIERVFGIPGDQLHA